MHLITGAALFAIAALFGTLAQAQTIQVNKDNKTIAITATDQATADPDVAVVSIGFQTFAPDADAAYAQGSKISNAILKKLSDAGVPDKAIQSNAQNLQRREDDNEETAQEREQRRFSLTQSWTVKTSAKSAADVLNIAIQAGANNSGDISWDLADRNALEAKAAEKALVRARGIAEQMAKGLNAKLSGLVYASNQAPNRGPRHHSRYRASYGVGGSCGTTDRCATSNSPARSRGISHRLRRLCH
jgi:uncharacterized protein YggE